MLRAILLLLLCAAPTLSAQSASGPRLEAMTVGIRPLSRAAVSNEAPAIRRYDNNGWLIGAIAGAVIGGYLGYRSGRGEPSNDRIFMTIISAVFVGGIGTVIGGVLGSR